MFIQPASKKLQEIVATIQTLIDDKVISDLFVRQVLALGLTEDMRNELIPYYQESAQKLESDSQAKARDFIDSEFKVQFEE